ncbi:hypothetical protein JB92DRAFT_986115 [Gautieria morchelliformis]|nr:hypothetical protein JB92DRAFT_986115 [Gautieria morchelliformis]
MSMITNRDKLTSYDEDDTSVASFRIASPVSRQRDYDLKLIYIIRRPACSGTEVGRG